MCGGSGISGVGGGVGRGSEGGGGMVIGEVQTRQGGRRARVQEGTASTKRYNAHQCVHHSNLLYLGCQPVLCRVLLIIQNDIANFARERCRAPQATGYTA